MDKAGLRIEMERARNETLSLFHEIVPDENELHRRRLGFRPIIWHLGHIGAFEAYWLLQKMGHLIPVSDDYMQIFDPIRTPREASEGLPSRRALTGLVTDIRNRVFDHLDGISFDRDDPLLRGGYVFEMVLQHELQHQETIWYLLHLLDPASKRPPSAWSSPSADDSRVSYAPDDMVSVPGGEIQLGAPDDAGFVYDNEWPPHAVAVAPFQIDRAPVTNAAFLEFMNAGGYHDARLWDAEGWAWRRENEIEHPSHWARHGHQWWAYSMFDLAPLNPDAPVYGVSWHEASAFARSTGKRLPTEAEWVAAAYYDWERQRTRRYAWGDAGPDSTRANFGNHCWRATPVGSFPPGRSPAGCLDMTGNVWEWTATVFDGHPGFKAYPYPEYSQLWFDGDHRVAKGGSWATSAPMLRSSFRNFFRRAWRLAFIGFRCAK